MHRTASFSWVRADPFTGELLPPPRVETCFPCLFKLVGFRERIPLGSQRIRSVLNLDEPTPIGKYLGCNRKVVPTDALEFADALGLRLAIIPFLHGLGDEHRMREARGAFAGLLGARPEIIRMTPVAAKGLDI